MNRNDLGQINRASGAAAGFVIATFIFVALIVIVKCSVAVPAIDADRDAAIAQSLMEIRSNEVVSLDNPGWIDRQRGIVRLPLDTALQIAAREWQNPAQARADLLAREEKATAPLPKQPAQPNPFE
ncbi:MAG TPA: hypothetical protein VMH30_05755 [Verrucomicrobiae bacterium]|nr:hypothetical protein [Verrucomicrobiae bacterium]